MKVDYNKLAIKGILWSSILYLISIVAYAAYAIVLINKGTAESFFNPYLGIVWFFGIICFVFLIMAFIYWSKYDKTVGNFLGLFFLHIVYMPFYSKILQKKMKRKRLVKA